MTPNTTALAVGLLLATHPSHDHKPLSELDLWNDGLSEMCYYDATDRIYGKQRSYTRVHLLNRQWVGEESGVKAKPEEPGALAVFKVIVAEEIPTENYNYRYLTTMFLRRPDLQPFKVTTSSQEWCGTTYKHLRWADDDLTYRSFSYFPGEGDTRWQLPVDVVPADALFVIARDVVARGQPVKLKLIPSIRSTHEVEPTIYDAAVVPAKAMKKKTAIGEFVVRRVEVDWSGPKTFFEIEEDPPHRIVRFQSGQIEGTIKFVERRAYWDRNWSSGYYEPNEAP